jgi:hypothetical protein
MKSGRHPLDLMPTKVFALKGRQKYYSRNFSRPFPAVPVAPTRIERPSIESTLPQIKPTRMLFQTTFLSILLAWIKI